MQVNNLVTRHGGGNSTSGSKKQDLGNSRGYQSGNKMFGSYGLFHGGMQSGTSLTQDMNDYFTIGTGGRCVEWGDLPVQNLYDGGGVTNGTRAVFLEGQYHPGSGWGAGTNTIQWVNIGKPGMGADFGESTGAGGDMAYTGDGSRGVTGFGSHPGGGHPAGARGAINIGTTSSAIDYGESFHTINYGGSGCCNGSRAIFAGGHDGSHQVHMEYWAIQTSATSVDYGDLTQATRAGVAHSDGSRGIHGGGDAPAHPGYSNTIAYFTIGTVGNAADFGDLTGGGQHGGGCSNGSRMVVAGLWGSGGSETGSDTLNMINIGILGNAVDYGEFTASRGYSGDVSGD